MKIIRTSTIPASINVFCKNLLSDLEKDGHTVIAVSSPGPQMQEIEVREKVKTIAVPMERHISPFKDLVSLWRMIKVFRKEKPDMVHSITPKAGLISMMAAWFCRVPVRLHTFTGLVFPTSKGLKQKILIFTDRLTCACATHIVPEGEGVKNDLQRFKITKKPLKVLGYGNIRGIDLEYYSPNLSEVKEEASKIKENLNLQEDDFVFVYIGRLVRDKGINELISAFKKLNLSFPNAKLLLVGRYEPNLDPIEAETTDEIDNNTSIFAVGTQKDVRPWLMVGNAFVFPSYREGFPNVVIEAGAMNLPSIVTDINGANEIIIEGKNGIIIPSQDENALFEAMKNFILNQETVNSMAKNTRQLVENRYEQSFVHSCLKNYYREICKI